MKKDDVLRRSFARLSALKGNLPTGSLVRADYVDEYHHVLEQLEREGVEIAEFRISEDKVQVKMSSGNYGLGKARYSEQRYVQRGLFLSKLDGLLGYFTLTYDTDRPTISLSR